ncbi:O-antigen ligase family protein [Neobacillus niacini]|uniref:O-antigen ligase family protein n=1 Tax=Neobacillus niacini TaxID=86668 RepID=UPI002FFF1E1E
MSLNIKKASLILISIIPNAFILKSMLYFLPDITLLLFIFLYGMLLIYLFKNSKYLRKFLTKFDFFIYLWVLFSAISLIYTPYPFIGLIKLLKFCFLGLGIVYFLKIYIENKKDWDFLFNFYVLSAFITQLCVIITFIVQGMPFGRFVFFDASPIPLGMLGAVTAIIVVIQIISKKISSFRFLIVFSSSVWVVLISSSKGPFLAMLIGLVVIIPSMVRNIKRGTLLFILGGITFYFISKTEQYRMMIFRLLYTAEDQSTHSRLNLYDIAINEFSKNPVIGSGIGVFNNFYPHNIFLEVIAEGGILSGSILMLFFIWIAYKYIIYIFRYKNDLYYFTPLVIVIMSVSVLMVSFTYVDLKFLYLGLGAILIHKTIKNTKDVTIKVKNKQSPSKKFRFKKFKIVWN